MVSSQLNLYLMYVTFTIIIIDFTLFITDQNVSRPYTPVWPLVETTDYGPISEDTLCLLVKCYPNGILSQHLCSLHQGDSIEVSRPQGSFECWTSKTNLILMAAGTGITPMISIIWNALHSSIKK